MDPKVINELKKLPAEFAMTVAKEFSSLDRSSVRNVPNYLCGIARRVAHTRMFLLTMEASYYY